MTVDLTDAQAREFYGKPLRDLCLGNLRHALTQELVPTRPTTWRGLGLVRGGRRYRSMGRPRPPFGWCAYREYSRDSVIWMPWWLAAVRWLVQDSKWAGYRALMLTGFYEVKEEGDYLNNGTWRWDFWRSVRAREIRHEWRCGEWPIL